MPVTKVKGGYTSFPGGPVHKTKSAAAKQLRAIKARQNKKKGK